MEIDHCPVCKSAEGVGKMPGGGRDVYHVTCPLCGRYVVSHSGATIGFEKFGPKHLLSGAIRNRYEREQRLELTSSDALDSLLDSVSIPETPIESIDLLLEHLERKMDHPGQFVHIDQRRDYPLLFAQDHEEFQFYLDHATRLGYIEYEAVQQGVGYRPTLQGWQRLQELKKTKAKSNQAFVAMLFDDEEIEEAWKKGIKPALEACDLKPLRIDLKEHNDLIIDHILAEIRKSGLLVAEFTGHSDGVYFESGFALGLGIPVIWSCKKEEMNDAHFDTSQYNHITWTTPEELKRKLTNRIKATLPFLVDS